MTYKAKIFLTVEITDIPAENKDEAEEKAFELYGKLVDNLPCRDEFTISCIDIDETTI